MNDPKVESIVPELAELMNKIFDLLNGTVLIPDVARIVLGYVRPCRGNIGWLRRYNDCTIVRFIVEDKFGVSLDTMMEYDHYGPHWHIKDPCKCEHEYLTCTWTTCYSPDSMFIYNQSIIKFSDIWRCAAIGSGFLDSAMASDIVSILVFDTETSPEFPEDIQNGYDISCLAPGFASIIKNLIHFIWFGKSNDANMFQEWRPKHNVLIK